MQENRVFITGLGMLSACGDTAEANWNALLEGRHGLGEISQWDLSSWNYRLGGELKDFQPAKMLPDRKLMKVISRQDVIGINVAMQAIEHSQLLSYRDSLSDPSLFNEETGIFVGSPGNKYFQQYDFLPLLAKSKGDMEQFAARLFEEVHPMWLLRILPNNVLAYTGILYGFKGINHNITNHAVGGMQALLEAYQAIKQGQAQRAIVIGYDVGIEPQALFYYEKLGLISSRHLKPFDKEQDGTLLAEGGGALVLESEASVRARSAICYGEILGGQARTEAAGLFSIRSEGLRLANLLNDVLEAVNLDSSAIDLVVAHGNGNVKSDASEADAIRSLFGSYKIPLTAFKWAMGHTLCASGIVDALLASYALKEHCLPGIANLNQVASYAKHLNIQSQNSTLERSKTAVVINRGFASMNACLVIRSCD